MRLEGRVVWTVVRGPFFLKFAHRDIGSNRQSWLLRQCFRVFMLDGGGDGSSILSQTRL